MHADILWEGMESNDSGSTRRTVLKSTGTALAVALTGVGSAAAADQLEPGCYKTTYGIQSYTDCSQDEYGPYFPQGTTGAIWDSCDVGDYEMVKFLSDDTMEFGWMRRSYLTPC